jgi:hypothetical protein
LRVDALNSYQATMHFNGQSTMALDGNRAKGESYCISDRRFADEGEAFRILRSRTGQQARTASGDRIV